MAKKQPELPGTRRDDEAPEHKPIAELDAACKVLDKAKGGAVNASQKVVEAKKTIQALLHQHDIQSYPYVDAKGIEREVVRNESIKTRKIKTDSAGDDE